MQAKNSIFLIIAALILLGLGYGYGFFSVQKLAKEAESPLAGLLGSSVVRGINVALSGEVTAITGRELTLTSQGETLTVTVKEGAAVSRLLLPEEEDVQSATVEEISFEDLEIGNNLNVYCQVGEDGTLEGIDLLVSPTLQ